MNSPQLAKVDALHQQLSEIEQDLPRRPYHATASLFGLLRSERLSSGDVPWEDRVALVRRHPILSLAQEDPFTRRAYTKPRGYAGDAVLIDHIYGSAQPEFQRPLGRAINRYTTASPATRAVRFRRQILAELIDRASAEGHGHCRVLALACGHLRELELSVAIRRGDAVEVVGLDQDADSLGVAREAGQRLGCRMETHAASIRAVLKRSLDLRDFDLVYAAGLFDYLEDNVAAALVSRMLEAVRPGGRVLIANFVPDIPDVGYMEACMDWFLKYRTESQLRSLLDDLPAELKGPIRTFHDPDENLAFLVATRPGDGPV
ncbi:MAG: methyltransferase domain-containing protein [Vicinamibacteria bacterium]|nr:methyltransferase domain-containing protein [Vicinamibacteria bacterium]